MGKDEFKGVEVKECFGKITWEFPPELNYLLHFTTEEQREGVDALSKLCLGKITMVLFAAFINLNKADTPSFKKFFEELGNSIENIGKIGREFMQELNLEDEDECEELDN